MLIHIIYAVVIMCMLLAASSLLNLETNNERLTFSLGDKEHSVPIPSLNGFARAAAIGILVAFINYSAPKLLEWNWLEVVYLFLIVALILVPLHMWRKSEDKKKLALIPLIIVVRLIYETRLPVLTMLHTFTEDDFWLSLFGVLPKMAFAASIGWLLWGGLVAYREKNMGKHRADMAGLAALILALTTIVVVLALPIIDIKWGEVLGAVDDSTSTSTSTPTSTSNGGFWACVRSKIDDLHRRLAQSQGDYRNEGEELWCDFHNSELQQDDDPMNNYDFGPPLDEGIEGEVTAEKVYAVFKDRIEEDPAMGSGVMAYIEYVLGTRCMVGLFYDECGSEWGAAINYAKSYFIANQEEYYHAVDLLFETLDSAAEIRLERGEGIEDQMYMNPLTDNKVPELVVMTSSHSQGEFLTFVFIRKGRELQASFRLECGGQPCNVSKKMGITPITPKPKAPTATPKPKAPTATPKPKAPTATPTSKPNTPTPTKKLKDPTKGTKVGKNDDPGPGPDTNNGVGANTSSEDKPTNSAYKSYDEYKEAQKNLSDTNKGQKQGGDANTPVVTSKPNTKVDGNGGNIDQKTPTQGAGTSQGSVSSGLGKWDGPVD